MTSTLSSSALQHKYGCYFPAIEKLMLHSQQRTHISSSNRLKYNRSAYNEVQWGDMRGIRKGLQNPLELIILQYVQTSAAFELPQCKLGLKVQRRESYYHSILSQTLFAAK